MTEITRVRRRPGPSRDARRAMRSAPLPDNLKPVHPGMPSGRYRPLNEADVLNISLPPRRGYHAYESLKISGKALKRKEREMQAANRNRKAIK